MVHKLFEYSFFCTKSQQHAHDNLRAQDNHHLPKKHGITTIMFSLVCNFRKTCKNFRASSINTGAYDTIGPSQMIAQKSTALWRGVTNETRIQSKHPSRPLKIKITAPQSALIKARHVELPTRGIHHHHHLFTKHTIIIFTITIPKPKPTQALSPIQSVKPITHLKIIKTRAKQFKPA